MSNLININVDSSKHEEFIKYFEKVLDKNKWIKLKQYYKDKNDTLIPEKILPNGSGIVIKTGGSSGGNHQCFHSFDNLVLSANATGKWLEEIGYSPENCIIFNSLPMYHISGLMPFWRSKIWGSKFINLPPKFTHSTSEINMSLLGKINREKNPPIISLVPTQLDRLLTKDSGVDFLKAFEIIWIGGAKLNRSLAAKARSLGIRLSPCYGATETCAMVTALSPNEFLNGETSCGQPLPGVELKLEKQKILLIKTSRIGLGIWKNEEFQSLKDSNGWWKSQDIAEINSNKTSKYLKIIGRADNAIISGGETVFPKLLEDKLIILAKEAGIAIEKVMFLPIKDTEWGERIIALIEWSNSYEASSHKNKIIHIKKLIKDWKPAEKPIDWKQVNELKFAEIERCNKSELEALLKKIK
tara:strand:- start:155 stop:1393 length:1239 start_codon:yes stop_codon:yes gene_type:complete